MVYSDTNVHGRMYILLIRASLSLPSESSTIQTGTEYGIGDDIGASIVGRVARTRAKSLLSAAVSAMFGSYGKINHEFE